MTSPEWMLLKARCCLGCERFLSQLYNCSWYFQKEKKNIMPNSEMIELFASVTCIDWEVAERDKDLGLILASHMSDWLYVQ